LKRSDKIKKNNYDIERRIFIIFTIVLVIFTFVIKEFSTNPKLEMDKLLHDLVIASISCTVGFFTGVLISIIEKRILWDYKVSIAFGFFFLGLGIVLDSFFKVGLDIRADSKSFIGLVFIILSTEELISLHQARKKEITDEE